MTERPLAMDSVDTIVCDIDGVVLLGGAPIAGAGAALERCRAAGLGVLFVTNNSTRAPEAIAQRLTEIVGFETEVGSVFSSGVATAGFIAGRARRVYVVGTDGLRATLAAEGIEVVTDWRQADAVVTGLDPNVTYTMLKEASLAVQHGATFYATNTDASYPAPDGQHPGAGAMTGVVRATTGVDPIVCGKPHEPMRSLIAGVGDRPLVIGDRPDTDIALGKVEGWPTVLVLTGVTTDPDLVPGEYRPDVVLESIADLPELLGVC